MRRRNRLWGACWRSGNLVIQTDPGARAGLEQTLRAWTVAEILRLTKWATLPGRHDRAQLCAPSCPHDPAMFISLAKNECTRGSERPARDGDKSLPLYGIPVAVKDNIDVAGLPTTAACPASLYSPGKDATAVARLRAAGALVIGKTNLDQVRTRLVGVRTPYGMGRNLFDDKLIQDGSIPARRWPLAPALCRFRSAPTGRRPRAGRVQ